MHYLTYVVIDHKEFIDTSDLDIHDIKSAVEEILMPEQDRMFDWYDIGERWGDGWPNNRMTVKDFLAQKEIIMPCLYFDYDGTIWDEDRYFGLVRLMGWEYGCAEYKDIQTRIKAAMLEDIKKLHPNDLIIIVDLHN